MIFCHRWKKQKSPWPRRRNWCIAPFVLVTGPTGSGKTTTLYTTIHAINTMGKNILTIEDPVGYQLELINQSQVRDAIGLSFARILRSVLRQDPDVIMVGESRDRETAGIAMQAALTGHPVLSTLHTSAMTLASKAV